MSSPKDSPNPQDYLNAHKNEYASFFKYGGEDALQYMLNQFETGNAEGLRGQIMMQLCKELLGARNNVINDSLSPQEWYNALDIRQEVMLPNYEYDGQDTIEKYIIAVKSEVNDSVDRDYLEVHAGGVETSWMLLHYPDLVRQEMTRKLTATDITDKDMYIWYNGGEAVRRRIPNGYIGNPSNINYEEAISFENSMVNDYVNAISIALKREP
jgi:hypothetical protein